MRKQILIGLLPLFVLLLAIGICAVALFTKLGGAIDVILRENYVSIAAMQKVKDAAGRMDAGLYAIITGDEERGRKIYEENLPVFDENLRIENGNITIHPKEDQLAGKIIDLRKDYTASAGKFFATTDPAARRKIYFDELLPKFSGPDGIDTTAQAILDLNQENMLKANGEARKLSADSTAYMALGILCAAAIALFFAYRLQRAILNPINALTASATELGEGNLDQVVPVQSQDELGQLADAFNKMATKLRAYRQITSDEILHARQMTEITFSAFPDPIIALDANGAINFKNPSAEKLLLKLKLDDHLPEQINEQVKAVMGGGEDYVPTSFSHAICVRPDDKETFFLPRIIGIRGDKGTVFGAAVILQNVTRLRLLDEVKNSLVSTVSHELKTPLTSVRMALHLLLEEAIGALNPKQTELLVAARDDSERLLTMINDLLDLARLESGESRMLIEQKSPARLVQDAVKDSKDFAETHGVKLAADIEESLPDVGVEERQIAHVFSNFISNAAQHSPRGEKVIVQARKHDGGVRFSVIDKGPGISAQNQQRVFDKFFRVPGAERNGGAGLGLSIAREIVHAHHGSVGVKSKPGEGSEFFFILPEFQKENAK